MNASIERRSAGPAGLFARLARRVQWRLLSDRVAERAAAVRLAPVAWIGGGGGGAGRRRPRLGPGAGGECGRTLVWPGFLAGRCGAGPLGTQRSPPGMRQATGTTPSRARLFLPANRRSMTTPDACSTSNGPRNWRAQLPPISRATFRSRACGGRGLELWWSSGSP